MKKELKYLILCSLMTLVGCSSEDNAAPHVPNGQPQPGDALELTVTASDFVTDGAPDTRATDNGSVTTFENNDRVGIIILDRNDQMLYNNLPYKYVSSSGKWVFDSTNSEGKEVCYYDSKAYTYIVYYPYSANADDCKNESDLKSKFKPQTQQSTKEAYRASDLMVSTTTSGTPLKSLTAELKHVYASISLSLPTTYKLDDGKDTKYNIKVVSDVNLTIGDTFYVPYQPTDGSFRCILPADITPGDIRCYYTFGGGTYGNIINISGKVVANTRYTSVITKTYYTLADAKAGDFYCRRSDGNGYLIPGDVALTGDPKKACVGIVFWTGDATQKDKTLQKDHPGCTHGLVVALNDVASGTFKWQEVYQSVQNWLDANKKDVYLSVGSAALMDEPLNNIQGYNNTKAIKVYNESVFSAMNFCQVDPVGKVVLYRNTAKAPDNSSDWYLPSLKELAFLYGKNEDNFFELDWPPANRDLINDKLNSIGSIATPIQPTVYWSSTEYITGNNEAFSYDFNNGNMPLTTKNNAYRVRAVLAF